MKANNIFRHLIFIFSLILITTTANSQGTTHTPMGQTVYLGNNWDTPSIIAAAEAWAAQWITDNQSDAVRIAPATSNYNCHSYAWIVVEGGPSTNAWMNQTQNGNPNLSKYWTNDAYSSTSYVGDHEKIFYGSIADHSAITTATPGKVRSKWGICGRYEHSTAQCPYNAGNLQYYKLVNPTISSSSGALCNNSQRTFSESSFTNISLNYDWSAFSPLSEISGDGTSSYIVASASQNGAGVVSLTIITPSGASSTVTKSVWVGPPTNSQISAMVMQGPPAGNQLCRNSEMTIAVGHPAIAEQGIYQFDWNFGSWSPYFVSYTNMGGVINRRATLNLSTSAPASQVITISANNGCPGTPFQKTFYAITCGYSMVFSPNPANDNTEVTLTNTDESDAVTYVVRVTNNSGQTLFINKNSGKRFTLPTSSLKDGLYIVEVVKGNEVYRENLVVKH